MTAGMYTMARTITQNLCTYVVFCFVVSTCLA
jgi:hypothetical protein